MSLEAQLQLEGIDTDRLQKLSSIVLDRDGGIITEWHCESLVKDKGNSVTGGVYRVTGKSRFDNGSSVPWSTVLKIVKADSERDESSHYNYWRREILAYESGRLNQLKAGIEVPQCYFIDYKEDGAVWLWLADFSEQIEDWKWTDFKYAAEKLGEFQALYLEEASLRDFEWVNKSWMRSWIKQCLIYRKMPDSKALNDIVSTDRLASLFHRFKQFEASIDRWLSLLEKLPKTFSHQDYHQKNIILNKKIIGDSKLVLIDWQFVSFSGVGEDLGRFFGLSLSNNVLSTDDSERVLSAYIKGMQRSGWNGDERLVRLGFLLSFALRSMWEVPKLLSKQEHQPDSSEISQLFKVVEYQMEAAEQANTILERIEFEDVLI